MQTVSRDAIESVLEASYDNYDYHSTIRDSYSGRAMYGQECFGIVFDHLTDSFQFFAELGFENADEQQDSVTGDVAWQLSRAAFVDDMGKGVIVYFPGWQLEES